MKPANFPGRKATRRVSALKRLAKRKDHEDTSPSVVDERAALEAVLGTSRDHRGHRSKKDHSHLAKMPK